MLQDIRSGQALFVQLGQQLHQIDRVSPELKKRVSHAYPFKRQDFPKQRSHSLLKDVFRQPGLSGKPALRDRKLLPVDFAVYIQRESIQPDKAFGDHVTGKMLPHMLPEPDRIQFPGAGHIGAQIRLAAILLSVEHQRLRDPLTGPEAALRLRELDAETAKLDLGILPPAVGDGAIRTEYALISGTVDPSFSKGIIDKSFFRQLFAIMISPRQPACDTYFSQLTDAAELCSLKDIDLPVVIRPSDGNGLLLFRIKYVGRGVNTGLGRSVIVDHHGGALLKLPEENGIRFISAEADHPDSAEAFRMKDPQKCVRPPEEGYSVLLAVFFH